MDLHAITVPRDPQDLKDSIYTLTAELLGAGLDPQRYRRSCGFNLQYSCEIGEVYGYWLIIVMLNFPFDAGVRFTVSRPFKSMRKWAGYLAL